MCANDEATYTSRGSNPKTLQERVKNKLGPKDYGSGRMMLGFSHDFFGFIKQDAEESLPLIQRRWFK